ncbi:hypothetical protein PoB_000536400 [Plakobranchus ocellatus]|uniref:Uncharacterized protein n=1 Tax=Plakobranchus ocellatus TaxID=259542 RepID=A0AAV3Y9B9_9GAST|nr:hypothetical protein PoB_000536400 [Plakobranchus ocellatus]
MDTASFAKTLAISLPMLPILEENHWTTIHTRLTCCRVPVNVTAFLTSALVFPLQRVGTSESGTVRLFCTLFKQVADAIFGVHLRTNNVLTSGALCTLV